MGFRVWGLGVYGFGATGFEIKAVDHFATGQLAAGVEITFNHIWAAFGRKDLPAGIKNKRPLGFSKLLQRSLGNYAGHLVTCGLPTTCGGGFSNRCANKLNVPVC